MGVPQIALESGRDSDVERMIEGSEERIVNSQQQAGKRPTQEVVLDLLNAATL